MKKRMWIGTCIKVMTFAILLFFLTFADARAEEPIYLELSGQVELEGDRDTEMIREGEFEFYIVSETKNVVIDENVRAVESGGRLKLGSFTFPQPGTYVFLISQKEHPGDEMGVYELDKSEYRLIVNIYRDSDSRLVPQITYTKDGNVAEGIRFENKYTRSARSKPLISVETKKTEIDGEIEISHMILIENPSETVADGIWLRQYIPAHSRYISSTGSLKYGAIEGKEHVTGFVPEIQPHGRIENSFVYRINKCRPDQFTIQEELLYEMLGAQEDGATNNPVNPAEKLEYSTLSE